MISSQPNLWANPPAKYLAATFLPVVALAFSGCGPSDPVAESEPEPAPKIASVSDLEQPIRIVVAKWDEIAEKVKQAETFTVVDVWSLSCEPCKKEFPGLIKLASEYGEKLHCVSVNVDYDGRRTHPPEKYREQVSKFLEANKAEIDNYICATPSDTMYETLEIESIPAVFIYDSQGNEVAKFVDAGETRGFTYENDITPKIAALLAESP